MVISSILRVFGLAQNHQHFLSQKKLEFIKLTTEYETLLREAHAILIVAKSTCEDSGDTLSPDIFKLRDAIDKQIQDATAGLMQIEESRELQLSTPSNSINLEKWDELISRRLIQKGAAESAVRNSRQIQSKLEVLLGNSLPR